jgi:dihydrodipicolinate synthase/N-acetylneuraminate lyase
MSIARNPTLPAVVPKRKITGISAILLPFKDDHSVDWDGFDSHVARTDRAGLTPAVNMDTGYANLIDENTRTAVLERTRDVMRGKTFTAGAYVGDKPGDAWNPDAYLEQIEQIQSYGATPIIFQSYGLANQDDRDVAAAYRTLAAASDRFIAFELGKMFAPFGRIYDIDLYGQIMDIPQCIGAKHSSLNRQLEWDRLELRNRQRPDFKVFTGNDLAIDMVIYGSDYLLGLSSFAPDLFGYRDKLWEEGSVDFYQLNDILQYLGFFAFRQPTPAYKHSAAQFLKLQGWLDCDHTHPNAQTRPDSDIEILKLIMAECNEWRETI